MPNRVYIIALVVCEIFFSKKSLQKVWWCSKKVLLLQSDFERAASEAFDS